jgi:glycosyltransferase involved in cell wall biosynthesis
MFMENKPLKIAYITPALYMAGGVERVLTLKTNYFAEHFGYDITIILTEGKDKPLFYPLSDKIKVVNLDIGFEELWTCSFVKKIFVYLRKQSQYKKALTKELMRIRPDITVSLLRREINFLNDIKDGSKKIGEMHINRANYRNFEAKDSNFVKNLFARYWSNSLVGHLKRLDRLVVLTETDQKAWKELEKVSIIPNPLPFTPSLVSLQTEKRIVAVARYSYEKGIDLLLQAWSLFEKKNMEWRLDVYGDGDRNDYEKMIDDMNIDRSRCCLNARIAEVEEAYSQSSIFVLTSRYEGFGLVIIEAMACGLPVVAFDCPWGPRSIIHDTVDGLLVKNGCVDELSDCLLKLADNTKLRGVMASSAKENVKRYQIGQIACEWKCLFERVVDKTN